MTDLERAFSTSCSWVRQRHEVLTEEDLLEFYGLYKQATFGDGTPGFTLNPIQTRKNQAWIALRGTSSKEAASRYILKQRTIAQSFDRDST